MRSLICSANGTSEVKQAQWVERPLRAVAILSLAFASLKSKKAWVPKAKTSNNLPKNAILFLKLIKIFIFV